MPPELQVVYVQLCDELSRLLYNYASYCASVNEIQPFSTIRVLTQSLNGREGSCDRWVISENNLFGFQILSKAN